MTANLLHVLLIEDSEDDAVIVVHELTRAGYTVVPERIDTPDGLVAALERTRWDLAIAGYAMLRFSGTAALSLLRAYDADLPFIFVSGTSGEDAAVAAMRAGAHDYIMKDHLARLVPAVERELGEAGIRRSRRAAEERLARLATHDALTDLPNRLLLHDRLRHAALASERAREPVALLVMGLDGFKAVTDSLGHDAGDRILQTVASRLRNLLRDSDFLARLGDDEFAILLPQTDGEGAMLAMQKFSRALRQPLVDQERSLAIGGSFGIACFPEHGPTGDALLQNAAIAMRVAKRADLGCTTYAAERDRHGHHRLTAIGELRDGIERDQFACEYQPIVSLDTGRVLIVEALARWRHPRLGWLPPSEFIDLAEQTGLIDPLTMILLDKALADWTGPHAQPGVALAVNLSRRNLRDPRLSDRIADALQARGALPSALVLEVTEDVIMEDPAGSAAPLARLHELGVTLAIDDFGAAYSSLTFLRQLPFDQLKIDRPFVAALAMKDDAVMRASVDVANTLGLTVVAEGVESALIQQRVRECGCHAAQGMFVVPPGPAAEIRRWVLRRQAREVARSA